MKFDHEVIEGVAELVRAEHTHPTHRPMVSEAIYWWPEHEGPWPSHVFFVADDWGDPLEVDAWEFFERALPGENEGKLRWVELPGFEHELVHEAADETAQRQVPRNQP